MFNSMPALVSRQSIAEKDRRATLVARPSGPSGVSQRFSVGLDKHVVETKTSSAAVLIAANSVRGKSELIEQFLRNRTAHAAMETERFPSSVRAWLNYARTCINSGDMSMAREALEKAEALSPRDPAVRATRGRFLAFQGSLDEALDIYADLLSSRDDAETRENVATILLAQGKVEEAIEHLKAALKKVPNRSSLHVNLGIAHLMTNKPDRAIAYFRQASEIEPSHQTYNGLGISYALRRNTSKAERAFRVAMQLDPRDPEATLNLAKVLGQRRCWQEVIFLVSDLLTLYPGHWEARQILGAALFYSGRFQEAAKEFRRVLESIDKGELDGDRAIALNDLGVAMLGLQETDKAEALLKESLRASDRRNQLAIENLARLYLATGKFERADGLLKELQEATVLSGSARLLVLQHLYLNERYEEALEGAMNLLQELPMDPEPAKLASCILLEVYDRYREAEELLRNVWHHNPHDMVIINNLAYSLILQGKLNEARHLLDRIPSSPDVAGVVGLATRGLLLIALDDLTEGAHLYNQAARVAEQVSRNLKALVLQKKELEVGRYWLKRGRIQQARDHLMRAADADVVELVFTRRARKLLEESEVDPSLGRR